ncbi:MAG: endonuclease/exonuclease/phosphatase family protein [Clostridia bacterium]|nr:endonuclease/exonuclease/phosphatase family protein [Clostridia bacterium]
MKLRFLCLALAILLLLCVVISCQKEPEPTLIDAEYQIVHTADDPYAEAAAYSLCSAIRRVIGERLTVTTTKVFAPETAGGKVIYVGNPPHMEELPALDENAFSVSMSEQGILIRGENPLALYLATEAIAKAWGTEEYGLIAEGALQISEAICEKLNTLTPGAETVISVMSQNVRCANDGNGNDIADRKVRLQQLVTDYDPDLLGTQEVTAKWMEIFEEYFGADYGMVGCSRDGANAKSGEWNTILYKKARFDLLESGTFWLTDTPNEASMTEGALCRRICTWAILKDKLTEQEVLFCNTHLDHSNDTVRDDQAKYLMQFINSHNGQYPVFLTGDFNTTYGKAPYKTVTATLADAHRVTDLDISTVKGTFHAYSTPKNEIDFCFFDSKKAEVKVYRILSETYNGFVSDHYGVIGYFQLK